MIYEVDPKGVCRPIQPTPAEKSLEDTVREAIKGHEDRRFAEFVDQVVRKPRKAP